MGTETVVADTTYTIAMDGTPTITTNDDPGKMNTQVNGTRNNKFWNNIEFNDNRVGPTQRTLKIRVEASGDVTGQIKSNVVNIPYTPPYSLVPTPLPETLATITYTGAEEHLILVKTYFEVWHDDDKEYSCSTGKSTTVEET